MMWWGFGDHWGLGGFIWMAFTVLFWIALIAAIVVLVRYLVRSGAGSGRSDRAPAPSAPGPEKSEALRILEERYARGEIDREEFLARKQDLGP